MVLKLFNRISLCDRIIIIIIKFCNSLHASFHSTPIFVHSFSLFTITKCYMDLINIRGFDLNPKSIKINQPLRALK